MSFETFYARTRELFDTVFGEGRVQLSFDADPDSQMLEIENGEIWLCRPNEDCAKFTWGTATHIPGSFGGPPEDCSPPDCDVVDLGETDSQDEAIKAVILLHTERLLNDRFDHEADEAEAQEFERSQQLPL